MNTVWLIEITDNELSCSWVSRLYLGKPSIEQLSDALMSDSSSKSLADERAEKLSTSNEVNFGHMNYKLRQRYISEGKDNA